MRPSLLLCVALLPLGLTACDRRDGDLPAPYRTLHAPDAVLTSAEAQARGRRLYQSHCVLCHGVHLDGLGVRRQGFTRPPRDFTDAAWRSSTSPRHVFYAIREGLHGTAMPAWKGVVNEEETWDLVAYVLSAGEADAESPPGGRRP